MIIDIIIWLIIGGVAGWLAGLLVKGYGFGLVGNIVVGIIGAILPVGFYRWPVLSSWVASSRRSSMPSLGRSSS
jgi:uncharacterized membrane protein YeaQ/YmgE (transglycosylase-associated protein family)